MMEMKIRTRDGRTYEVEIYENGRLIWNRDFRKQDLESKWVIQDLLGEIGIEMDLESYY